MKLPPDITVPSQSAATARWWARRWYKNATPAERQAMREVLDECGTGAVQLPMNFDKEGNEHG